MVVWDSWCKRLVTSISTYSALQRLLAAPAADSIAVTIALFYKVIVMNATKRAVIVAQFLLIFPSVLFMGALVVRALQPLQNEPAHTAQQIVMWYAVRMWTLWLLLIALPFAVLVTGCVTLARNWRDDMKLSQATQQMLAAIHADRAMLFVAATTLTAGAILAIVVLHMAAN